MGIASENEGVYVERDKISFTGEPSNICMTFREFRRIAW